MESWNLQLPHDRSLYDKTEHGETECSVETPASGVPRTILMEIFRVYFPAPPARIATRIDEFPLYKLLVTYWTLQFCGVYHLGCQGWLAYPRTASCFHIPTSLLQGAASLLLLATELDARSQTLHCRCGLGRRRSLVFLVVYGICILGVYIFRFNTRISLRALETAI